LSNAILNHTMGLTRYRALRYYARLPSHHAESGSLSLCTAQFLLLPSDPAVASNALAIQIVFPLVGVTPAYRRLGLSDMPGKHIKEMAEQAISKETGEYIMTLAEKIHNEGKLEGEIKGLKEAIELGITLKFPGDIDTVMARVNKIDDLDTLKKIEEAIKTARDISEIWH